MHKISFEYHSHVRVCESSCYAGKINTSHKNWPSTSRSTREVHTFKDKAGTPAIHRVEVHSLRPGDNKVSLRIEGGAVLVCTHLIKKALFTA